MSDFLRPDGERIDNGDGTTTWVVEMGETTENADLLVFGPAAVRAQVGDTVRFVNNSFAPHTASFFVTGAEPVTDSSDRRAIEPTRPPPERLTAVGFVNTGSLPPDGRTPQRRLASGGCDTDPSGHTMTPMTPMTRTAEPTAS